MGRKIEVRRDYLGEIQTIGRLRQAARIDPSLSKEQVEEVEEKTTALIECLMRIETERTSNNDSPGKEKTG